MRDAARLPDRSFTLVATVALMLALFPAALRGGLVLDDSELIFSNPAVSGELSWLAAVLRDYFHHIADAGTWRPLATLSLRLDHTLFGERVGFYHLSNLLLHGVVVWLALSLLLTLTPRRWAAVGAAGLFALHPALCDATVWIAGRTSMLSAIGPLAGALWLRRQKGREIQASTVGWVVTLALLGGLLGKEDALAFAPLLVAVAPSDGRRRAAAGVACVVAAGLYFLGRWWALGGPLVGPTTPALAGLDLGERLLIGCLAFVEALRLAVWPVDFPPRYTAQLLRESGLGPGTALTVAWGALVWLGLWVPALRGVRRRGLGGLGPRSLSALLVAVAFLPFAQLIPIGEVLAPRFLYLPLLFATPLFLACFERLLEQRIGPGVTLALLAAAALGCFERAADYADAGAWNEAVLRADDSDVRAWNNLGLHRETKDDLDGARAAWDRAIELDPQYSKPWSNLGRLAYRDGQLEEAERAWRRALELGPRNPVAHVNLASLLTREGRHAEAADLYARATALSPGLAAAWHGLALARLRAGQLEAARSAWERASALDPEASATRALGERIRAALEEQESRR